MLRPKKLEIEGFRSFKEKTTIEFPDRGAVLISGKYKDSSLSSGSGKSSILLAISFALGICKLPATELKNWDSKKISVRLTLTDGEREYVIVRDPKLSLVINGEPYTGLAKGADEKLDEILQVKSDLAESLVNRFQRSPGKFINATDSSKKEFLAPLLKLDQVEIAADSLSAQLTQLVNSIALKENSLGVLRGQASQWTVSETDVESARTVYAESANKLSAQGLDDQLKDLVGKIGLIDAEIYKISSVKRQMDNATYENGSIRNTVVALQSEIEKLKNEICPTCAREWDKSRDLMGAKESQKKALLDKMQVNLAVIKNSQLVIEQEKNLLEEKQRLTQLVGQKKAPLDALKQTVAMAKSNLEMVSNQLNVSKRLQSQLETEAVQLKALVDQKGVLEIAVDLMGRNGFLGSIFDEVLVEIESRTNDMLALIPNVNTFAIGISSTSVTKAGNAKKSISTVLYKDGKDISVKSLSGGQMCSLELCTDLAVRETICSRAGTNLGWLALDEAMDGLDVESKQAALNIVKSKVNGLVLIIDHSTEIKEGFEKVVEVEFDGRQSYVSS